MDICFYNFFHIGDIYFASMFINIICNLNYDTNFLYYFINGYIFFKNTKNIKRIDGQNISYNSLLNNGEPPENLVDTSILQILKHNDMEKFGDKVIKIKEKDILFINTWCISLNLNHLDYHIPSAVVSYKNLINTINKKYNLQLSFKIDKPIELIENVNLNYDFIDYKNLYNDKHFIDTIFIFNFVPRSLYFNMGKFNNFIFSLSEKNKIILSFYDKIFANNPNITFIDRDYQIYPNMCCDNLLKIWDIAILCKKIILILKT